ncbi:ArnT family glycosyltransferase [Sphingomonas sp. MMS24-J45]|uniref:ArnT family glycosyltransferase n=1 Tax=Sphingomonas sp. MMS24-J45 TaxID=3238806 RepID=UPI0038510D7A
MHEDFDLAARISRHTLIARAALAVAALAFAWGVARLALHAADALADPFGRDYGEGVVWQQMLRIIDGTGYAPLREFPAFVFNYPPVYHLLTAATASTFGLDQLFAGRLVSLVSTIIAAVLAGVMTATAIGRGESRRVRAAAGAVTALSFVTLPLWLTSALLMQIDMLALAFTMAGLVLVVRAVERPNLAIAAGVLFTIALYTRQTSLPAPTATFLILLIARPRAAWLLLGSAILSSSAALGLIQATQAPAFLTNIIFYNLNRIAWDHATKVLLVLLANIVPIALGGIGFAATMRRLDPRDWRTWRDRMARESGLAASAVVLLMVVIKTLMLPMILKSGANDNYLIDWFVGLAILIGIAIVPVIRAATAQPSVPSGVLLLLIGLGLPIQMLDPPLVPVPTAAENLAEMQALVARVRASDKPVVSDDMVLLRRAGQSVVWEPAMIAELGSAGVYDQARLAMHVRRGAFGFFVTHGERGDLIYDQRFTPIIADAIDAAYPRRERVGPLTLHLPR